MSKRNINQVSNAVQNMNNKKMKTEEGKPSSVAELLTILSNRVDETRKNKSKNLNVFQQEIDDLIQKFREEMEVLNGAYFTRQDIKKYEMFYLLNNRNMIDYLNVHLQGNKDLPREFYLKNTSKIIQEILRASQTALGQLFGQHYPKWKNTVQNKIRELSIPRLSTDSENVKEVQELRLYTNKITRQVNI